VKKTTSLSSRNLTLWYELNICMIIHRSTGFNYLIDKFAVAVRYIFEHLKEIIVIIFICLFSYGSIYRHSDVGVTMLNAVNSLRQDMKDASQEIWTCFKNASTILSQSITIVKVIELLLIGFLPELSNFLLKTFTKLGKL
jgi:hypothetical protein